MCIFKETNLDKFVLFTILIVSFIQQFYSFESFLWSSIHAIHFAISPL
ncbi:hypothetical protein FM120_26145 [Sphingobacterium faecium PCAi_F2.5]|nr:hypothetical protein FM120_26145 [Sphingobacterium faecium PCAi_F2.5]